MVQLVRRKERKRKKEKWETNQVYDKTVIYLLSCEDIFIRFFFPIPKAKTCGQMYLMVDKKFRCFEYERVPRIIFTIPCLMKECVGIFIELV